MDFSTPSPCYAQKCVLIKLNDNNNMKPWSPGAMELGPWWRADCADLAPCSETHIAAIEDILDDGAPGVSTDTPALPATENPAIFFLTSKLLISRMFQPLQPPLLFP